MCTELATKLLLRVAKNDMVTTLVSYVLRFKPTISMRTCRMNSIRCLSENGKQIQIRFHSPLGRTNGLAVCRTDSQRDAHGCT